jgi:hypothetical protein
MDPGFYEDRTGRHHGLLIVLEDRRPSSEDDPVIHQFTDARHDARALEKIARTMAHHGIGITAREHALAGVLARADQAPPASELAREPTAHG